MLKFKQVQDQTIVTRVRSILEKKAGPHLVQAAKDTGAFIAGGAITSAYNDSKINDLDFFFGSLTSRLAFENIVKKTYIVAYDSENAVTFKPKGSGSSYYRTQVQTIKKMYGNYTDILSCFDFFACMGAYSFIDDKLTVHERFEDDCKNKVLCFNLDALSPLSVIPRIPKYVRKGFSISNLECLKIGLKCTEMSFLNWDDLRDQVNSVDAALLGQAFGSIATECEPEDQFSVDTFLAEVGFVIDKEKAKKVQK